MLTKCKQLSDRALASSGATVASGTFELLSRPDADVVAVTNAASCRFTCHDRRGKDVEIAVSNSVAAYAYALDCCGIAMNETAAIGGVSRTLLRGVDGQGREARPVR